MHLRSILCFMLLPVCSLAQTPAKPPEFAVATIRPAKPNGNISMLSLPDYGLKFENLSLQAILRETYGLQEDQIVGAPAWVKSSRFDIEAKVDDADREALAKMDGPQKRHMIQPFLEDRFKLKFHYETRQLPHYELVVAKSGPKFKAIPPAPAGEKPPHSSWMSGRTQIKGSVISMEALAMLLSQKAGGTVVDKTGLKDLYAVELHWTPDDTAVPPEGEATAPSFFTAVQEQLGLKLEAVKAPVQVMVVDHIEQPTED